MNFDFKVGDEVIYIPKSEIIHEFNRGYIHKIESNYIFMRCKYSGHILQIIYTGIHHYPIRKKIEIEI
jgi:hypothetical protein